MLVFNRLTLTPGQNRWLADGGRLRASMELALQTIQDLDREIAHLHTQRQPFRR